jgi:hypothetical protein
VHRIVATLVPALAALASTGAGTAGIGGTAHDRRRTRIVDGTLIPTRDHARAARSKNYRWSCNAQLLGRHRSQSIMDASSPTAVIGE